MPYTSLFQLGHCYYVATKISNKKLSGDEVHGTDLASIDVSSIIYLQVMLAWQTLGDHLGSWFDMFQKPKFPHPNWP